MAQTGRPLSPHLQVYKWQVQMVTSILHRATGIANVVGSLLIVWGVVALAAGADSFATFHGFVASPVGMILLLGWTWSVSFHLINGIRHLVQDTGAGYGVHTFIRSSWTSVIGSLVLTVLIWAWVLMAGGAA